MTARVARLFFSLTLAGSALWLAGCASHGKQPAQLAPGATLPKFTYALEGARTISTEQLKGHPYVLWLMATWCSSCQGGTEVMAKHIAQLRSRGVRVVQLELANDLGYPGPPLSTFRSAAGSAGRSPNWYWGHASVDQTRLLDPGDYPDIYYLVNPNGTIAGISGAPAATWNGIVRFSLQTSAERSS